MIKQTILQLPVPVVVAGVLPQLPTDLLGAAPEWAATGVLSIWVIGWFLDRLGRLPGTPTAQTVRLHEEAEEKLEAVHSSVSKIEELHSFFADMDSDGVSRWPRFLQESRRTRNEQHDLYLETKEMNRRLDKLLAVIERQVDLDV